MTTRRILFEKLQTEEDSFNYAKTIGLITVTRKPCTNQSCEGFFNLEKGKTRHQINLRYRCNKRNCRKTESIYKNTIFDSMHLSFKNFFDLLYLYCEKKTLNEIKNEIKIDDKTIISFKKKIETIIEIQGSSKVVDKIGGFGLTCEVDEVHLTSRKNNQGRILACESYWVVGVICRETKELRLILTKSRNKIFLNEFLSVNVELGTRIISDGWRGYRDLSNLGFLHSVVIHQNNFVDPYDSTCHTNTIERTWRSLRKFVTSFNNIICIRKEVKLFEIFFNMKIKSAGEKFDCIVEMIRIFYS